MALPALLTLLAAFAQVILTLWAIVQMGLARLRAIKAKVVDVGEIAIDDRSWPDPIKLLQANVRNQFETPVILFAGVGTALALGVAGWGVALFAWTYIATRIVHRAVHVGRNRLGSRFRAYVVGLLALAGLWVALIIGALTL